MSRLNRDDWLKEGLLLVAQQGIEAVTIDVLCQSLNVTKGSFYHHFKNVENFRAAMLDYWEAHFTRHFISVSAEGKTPRQQFQRLVTLIKETPGIEETSIRAWAQTDTAARSVVERVDKQRLEFLNTLLRDIYADPSNATTMARLFYSVLLGAPQMLPLVSHDEFADMYDLLMRLHNTLVSDHSDMSASTSDS